MAPGLHFPATTSLHAAPAHDERSASDPPFRTTGRLACPDPASPMRMFPRRGLTVIELVIIIVIVAVVGTLVFRSLRPRTTIEVPPATTATPGVDTGVGAARLDLVTPLQATPAGSQVEVRVRVTSAVGTPVSGAPVTFTVTSGGGQVVPALAVADSAGTAHTSWTLGAAGGDTLTATLADSTTITIAAPGAPAPRS